MRNWPIVNSTFVIHCNWVASYVFKFKAMDIKGILDSYLSHSHL